MVRSLKRNKVLNYKGQIVIENLLMMIVTIGLLFWGTQQLRTQKALAKVISGPWQKISGMIESGVWEDATKARAKHPNQINRSNTVLD